MTHQVGRRHDGHNFTAFIPDSGSGGEKQKPIREINQKIYLKADLKWMRVGYVSAE